MPMLGISNRYNSTDFYDVCLKNLQQRLKKRCHTTRRNKNTFLNK